jgi:CRP/FNR family cyclic AMP-dependent transcriptional regulator
MKTATPRFLDRRVYFDGNVIFAEGQNGDAMFLIESGRVSITRSDAAEREIQIATVGAHGLFGEMALIDGSPRMATAKAVGQTTVVAISPAEFASKLEGVDDKTRSLVKFLIRYCRETLPFAEREKDKSLAKETKDDILARRSLNSPQARNARELGVPFLSALLEMLIGYTQRRLPPEGKAG